MERTVVENTVEESVKGVCGVETVGQSERLKEDCGLDSLSLVSVLVDLEERLGIAFDDGDLDPAKLITVKDLVDLVWKSV